MRQTFVLVLLVASTGLSAAEPVRIAITLCPGQGYVAYGYPAVGSCPCVDESCFHPGLYYACCGDADPTYKKQFWKRWTKAHFCGGSLLDGVPCHCVSPPAAVIAIPSIASPTVPPAPPEEKESEVGRVPAQGRSLLNSSRGHFDTWEGEAPAEPQLRM